MELCNPLRFKTIEEAEQCREKLIRFIWENGLQTKVMPDITPNVVRDKVRKLCFGSWEHKLDTTHKEHKIFFWVLDDVEKSEFSLKN